jgi:hypothetical protein
MAAAREARTMDDDPNDRYDPDRWMGLGRDLKHFRPGGPEADLFYEANPELGRYVWRWWNMLVQASHRAAWERDISPPAEEDIREMWRLVRSGKAP